MTTIGPILIDVMKKYDDESKQRVIDFYAANDEKVELPESLTANGALVYTVIDKDGKRHKYTAFHRDVSLEAMMRGLESAA